MIETGKNAPTGAGKYVFNTRLDQNKTIYDILDMYVMELAGLKQVSHLTTVFAVESANWIFEGIKPA